MSGHYEWAATLLGLIFTFALDYDRFNTLFIFRESRSTQIYLPVIDLIIITVWTINEILLLLQKHNEHFKNIMWDGENYHNSR